MKHSIPTGTKPKIVPPERRIADLVSRLRKTNAALSRVIRQDRERDGQTDQSAWAGEMRLVASNRKLLRTIPGKRRPLAEKEYPALLALMNGDCEPPASPLRFVQDAA